ncbi:MAG: homoserine dehydrogenase [Phycisphaerales bacterium]|nr:homoserine dehydrogenase [Phycisphaerales bacterium]
MRIAMIGLGTVGAGLARLIDAQGPRLREQTGRSFELAAVLVRDPRKPREAPLPPGCVVTADPEAFFAAASGATADVLVEVAGGAAPGRGFALRALRAGMHLVTANKAMLAAHGAEVAAAAQQAGRELFFEASVCGGVPVVAALARAVPPADRTGLLGVVNGTCNFILSAMAERGTPYASALAEAQRLGYAEADPTFDVSGRDSAEKLAILASLAAGRAIQADWVATTGITGVTPAHLAEARAHRCAVRLIAAARIDGPRAALRVGPAFTPLDHPLGRLSGPQNGLAVRAEPMGEVFLSGPGAGAGPTASAVLSDLRLLGSGGPGTPFPTTTASRADITPLEEPGGGIRWLSGDGR